MSIPFPGRGADYSYHGEERVEVLSDVVSQLAEGVHVDRRGSAAVLPPEVSSQPLEGHPVTKHSAVPYLPACLRLQLMGDSRHAILAIQKFTQTLYSPSSYNVRLFSIFTFIPLIRELYNGIPHQCSFILPFLMTEHFQKRYLVTSQTERIFFYCFLVPVSS